MKRHSQNAQSAISPVKNGRNTVLGKCAWHARMQTRPAFPATALLRPKKPYQTDEISAHTASDGAFPHRNMPPSIMIWHGDKLRHGQH